MNITNKRVEINKMLLEKPYSHRVLRFESEQDFIDMLNGRQLKRIGIKEPFFFDWNMENKEYLIKGDGKIVDSLEEYEFDSICNAKVFSSALCVSKLKIGNIHYFIKTIKSCDIVNQEYDWSNYKTTFNFRMDMMRELFLDTWIHNRKKKVVIGHLVNDVFSRKGEFRGFVTDQYKYKTDLDVLFRIPQKIFNEERNNLTFKIGYATPTLSHAIYVDENEMELTDNVTCCKAIKILNSEFGGIGVRIESVIYIPNYDLEIVSAKRLKTSIAHTGEFNGKLRIGINATIGRYEQLFNIVKSAIDRVEALDIEETFEVGEGKEKKEILTLHNALNKVSSQAISEDNVKVLIDTIKENEYPMNAFGISLGLANMRNDNDISKTQNQRDALDNTNIDMLIRIDEFVETFGREPERIDAIDIYVM